MAALVHRSGRSFSELLAGFRRYPQVLVNIRVARKPKFETVPRIEEARRAVDGQLGDDGRLLLRYSGTEPLARVMIEGPEQGAIDAMAQQLAGVIREELGA